MDKVLEKLSPNGFKKAFNTALINFGQNVDKKAKELSPIDEAGLRSSIFYDVEGLKVTVGARANYAAYLEFGTRKFAAEYVATLPNDWKELAQERKGPAGGTFAQLVLNITEWVHRKGLGSGFNGKIGITGTYSIKSRRRTGSKATQAMQDKQVAYLIARKIVRDGIKPHPFLYPAVNQFIDKIPEDIKTEIRK